MRTNNLSEDIYRRISRGESPEFVAKITGVSEEWIRKVYLKNK